MRKRSSFGFPLLAKELIEQSARRRTYVLRTVYAVLFFGFALMIFWGSIYSDVNSPFELLGQGRNMFTILMTLQIMGVLLFTPALTCGAISSEKERNTIGLLFLTRLGPTSILIEKYLGRLILMGSYLLLSLPIFGFCYTLGGIEQRQVWFGFYGLVLTVCQISALGLMCSTFFRTTVSAFIATYMIGISIFFGPIMFFELLPNWVGNILGDAIWRPVSIFVDFLGQFSQIALAGLCSLLGMQVSENLQWNPTWVDTGMGDAEIAFAFFPLPMIMSASQGTFINAPNWQILAFGMPAMVMTVVMLLLSRLFLVTRAFVTPKRYLLRIFKSLDRMFHQANQRFTKGIVLIQDAGSLPKYEPITWRETTKSTLGSFRYLIRMFLLIEIPVLIVGVFAVGLSGGGLYSYHRHPALIFINFLCWIIAMLLTIVRAATLVAGERSHETIDVLLTTPISSRQFVTQKFKGVVRLMLVVSLPLLTGMVLQAWYCDIVRGGIFENLISDPDRNALCYFVCSVLSVAICLPLFAWVSMFFGMWMKTSTRAIFAALAFIVAWMIVPLIVLIMVFEMMHVGPSDELAVLLISSPATVPFAMEIGEIDDIFDDAIWFGIAMNFVVYGGLLFAARFVCLKNAARLLGRSEDDWS